MVGIVKGDHSNEGYKGILSGDAVYYGTFLTCSFALLHTSTHGMTVDRPELVQNCGVAKNIYLYLDSVTR